uniref:Retrovirus-related Pol polyprotein from transposon TNT 1-94 n=1 Tax=Tanacetum cinerariifolium TaxID=118510 RepID=A0A6L2KYB4_TANCI|nr:retrovirus-related Pol polyprotein from transposon TNT 1-94 [Tanacetum cinerariifolium]
MVSRVSSSSSRALDNAANKEEPVRRGPGAGAPRSTLRRSSQNSSTEDVLPLPGNVNMAFDLQSTKDVLPLPGSANMAFDLQSTEDVLPLPGSANMEFDLRQTKDVLPWLGSANMAFDLRSTEDVLPWPGSANIVFDLVLGLQRLSHMFYIRRYLCGMHEDNYNERHGRTVDTKKESMSGRAEYRGRKGPMTADTKKENMTRHAERHRGCDAALETLLADMKAGEKAASMKKAYSTLILGLGDRVLREVAKKTTAAGIWTKLTSLYMTKFAHNIQHI